MGGREGGRRGPTIVVPVGDGGLGDGCGEDTTATAAHHPCHVATIRLVAMVKGAEHRSHTNTYT